MQLGAVSKVIELDEESMRLFAYDMILPTKSSVNLFFDRTIIII